MNKKPTGQSAPGKIAKTHEKVNPAGKRDAPRLIIDGKPVRES